VDGDNKIKVGIFCPEAHLGGEMVYINSIIDACSKIDGSVDVFAFTKQKGSCNYNKANVTVVSYEPIYTRFKHGRLNSLKRWLLYGLEKLKLTSLIQKTLPVDVLIAPYVSYDLLRIRNAYIINPQDLRHRHRVSKLKLKSRICALVFGSLYKRVVMRASLVVVDSEYNKQDLIKYYNVPKDKIRIIHSLPDITALKALKKSEQQGCFDKYNLFEKYIYYPAHLIEAKNHLNLLEALRKVREKHGEVIPLILSGGEQKLLHQIQERAESYNLSVRYLGYIDYADVILILKKAVALVFASLFDPYALPLWEAFYIGVPVVSSNVCALPEQVGNAGLLFDPNNPEDMADKIYKVWTDEQARKEFIRKGYERVEGLTLENYAEQWEEVIFKALEARRTTRLY